MSDCAQSSSRTLKGAPGRGADHRNDRSLRTTGGEWVRNGERWLVTDRRDGALTVDSLDGRGSVNLPGKYVAENVTLAYALTVHKAQGMTIDAGVLIADDRTTAEQLYGQVQTDRIFRMLLRPSLRWADQGDRK